MANPIAEKKNYVNVFEILEKSSKTLVSWWNLDNKDNLLQSQTEGTTRNYLDGFYLFPLNEFTVNSECDDISKFIHERFQAFLSALNIPGISFMFLATCRNNQNKFFIGLKHAENDKKAEFFTPIVNGLLAGKNVNFLEQMNVSTLADGYNFGGIISGIPTVSNNDKSYKFNISSVIRSLYGKDYTLAIISNPVSESNKQLFFNELLQIRDNLHSLAKRTVDESTSNSFSVTTNKQTQVSISQSTNNSFGANGGIIGATVGASFGGPPGALLGFMLGSTLNYSKGSSKSETTSTTEGISNTESEQLSNSLSFEQQNGIALELEKIADQHINRLIQGFNAGYWETSITFATNDKVACDIIGGSFIGELSKPNDKLLPPPRFYYSELKKGQPLFLPKANLENILFPKQLSSYITSEELAIIASPPNESLPGFEIKRIPSLALSDTDQYGEINLGHIADHGNPLKGHYLSLSTKDLNKHLFVCGLTGSGKTTTVKNILKDLTTKSNIPFLVLESAKRDYRQLLADDAFKNNLLVFTIGDATIHPIRFNPFYIQKGIHPLNHIDYLKAIFNASFSLYGPMPHIIEKCLHNIYLNKGWNLTTGLHSNFIDKNCEIDEERYNYLEHYYCFPTLNDLKDEIECYINNEMEYSGELKDNIRTAILARLDSLCIGAKGLMFNTYDFYSIEDILSKNVIFEMESLADDDDKAFFVGLILTLISEYRQKNDPATNPGQAEKGLCHFLVIEEAHRLLKNVDTERSVEMLGNPKGKAVDVFCNIISEMRAMGQGVAVVEQIPSKISPDVIKNSNTKIVHRLVSRDDQSLLAGSLSMNDKEASYINMLKTGHALCFKERMERPVEIAISKNVNTHAISNHKIIKLSLDSDFKNLHPYEAYELVNQLKYDGKKLAIKFLNSLATSNSDNIKNIILFAINEVKHLLTIKNIFQSFSNNDILDFYKLHFLKLFNCGIYRNRNNHFPNEITYSISIFFREQSTTSYNKLLSNLQELWKPYKPNTYILEIIENLTMQFLYNYNQIYNLEDCLNIVRSYFLIPDEDTIVKIADKWNRKESCING